MVQGMSNKITGQALDQMRSRGQINSGNWIKVGLSTCGVAAGGDEVYQVLSAEVARRGLAVAVKKTGCIGSCYCEPLVEVQVEGMPRVLYGRVDKAVALRIIEEHVVGNSLLQNHIYDLQVSC